MKVIKSVLQMQHFSRQLIAEGRRIGFVPTMGYLHEGHLSLVREAKKHSDYSIVSIFVNPAQFGPSEDFEKYPRDFERDEAICAKESVDLIFYPERNEMYLPEHATYVVPETLSDKLCGKSRPGHFRGVATVVAKLFNIVKPQVAVFGQKDAQQCLIIRRMVTDLNFDIEIIIAPIVREEDSLAMSSRNKYLTVQERREATCLKQALNKAEELIKSGEKSAAHIREAMFVILSRASTAKLDYLEIVDFERLEPRTTIQKNTLIALAVYFGQTRLIDNILIT